MAGSANHSLHVLEPNQFLDDIDIGLEDWLSDDLDFLPLSAGSPDGLVPSASLNDVDWLTVSSDSPETISSSSGTRPFSSANTSSSTDEPSSQAAASHPSLEPASSARRSVDTPHAASLSGADFDNLSDSELDFGDFQQYFNFVPPIFGRRTMDERLGHGGAAGDSQSVHSSRQTSNEQSDELVRMEFGRRNWSRQSVQPRRPDRSARSNSNSQRTVIDLTDEPDDVPDEPASFSEPFRAAPTPPQLPPQVSHISQDSQQSQSSNPRRQAFRDRRTPSLTRSDGSLLGTFGGGMPATVIDLTDDSPEAPNHSQPIPAHASSHAAEHYANHFIDGPARLLSGSGRERSEGAHNGGAGARAHDDGGGRFLEGSAGVSGLFRRHFPGAGNPYSMEGRFASMESRIAMARDVLNRTLQNLPFGPRRMPPDVEVQILGQHPIIDNPLANHPVHLNYRANGMHRVGTPRPPFIPPPPPRAGFTRDTGPDLAVVCPSCDEELAYNPDETAEDGPPAKRAKTRKEREEHHFWAVKACGHVFCNNCYHTRREMAKKEVPGSFRLDPKPAKVKKVLCAVEECESDVTGSGAWIGIFL